jgi:D-alanyl-lipoteichoic acid acyltransferase DltB (MBOAT superfamily)
MYVVRNFLDYFCFIIFFPHMVAGPIQQAKHLLVQFQKDRYFNAPEATEGLRQMLWGFFKKMVVSDNLGPVVSAAYAHPQNTSGWGLLWATYFFAIQIYCDFSGYTDIAIGCAKLFGLNMTRNFAFPYFATNIKEFWRRWHISLTTWFREYLYIPLGGNQQGELRTLLNVCIVFLVSGLWHGANWTFVVWGGLHGLYFVLYTQLFSKATSKARVSSFFPCAAIRFLSVAFTFHLVLLAWVFFRAESLSGAFTILLRIFAAPFVEELTLPALKLVLLSALVFVPEWLQRHQQHALALSNWSRPVRWALYYGLVFTILFVSHVGETPFIYFQF